MKNKQNIRMKLAGFLAAIALGALFPASILLAADCEFCMYTSTQTYPPGTAQGTAYENFEIIVQWGDPNPGSCEWAYPADATACNPSNAWTTKTISYQDPNQENPTLIGFFNQVVDTCETVEDLYCGFYSA